MAFMDQFRFGGQNDLLQMPNQGGFGMMQSPFGQQQPMQQRGFGMFQSPWQGYNPQPGNMGYNPQPVQPGYNPQQPGFQQPQNPNIGHNNPRFQVNPFQQPRMGVFPGESVGVGTDGTIRGGADSGQPWSPGFNPQATAPHQPYNWFKAMQGG